MILLELVQIPNYKILALLHESDRTLVYRGRNMENGQPVAIKLMRNEYPSFNELVQFRNQYAISKNLEIEGIVKPYALERYKNRYALIMEDVGGISLAEYKNGNFLSLSRVFNIAIQLAEILHQLHQKQIIHKDLKPANILIQPETQHVKLIDFSISTRLPQETQTITPPNVLEGTLAYLSPEQTGRMNRRIDYRSDFYALGATLYELLAGHLPFNSNDPMALVHAHLTQMPPVLESRELGNGSQEEIPVVLSDIILKLMAKNAEDRYQSALGLKYDLEKCQTQWQEKGAIASFVLGERDLCDRFLIPEKLYGREAEVQALLDAFERVASGASEALGESNLQTPSSSPASPASPAPSAPSAEMLLVAGFSGIGKTAVINEVHKPIVKNRGYFIKGKFDQFNHNRPFSAFVQAFRDLMGQLLGENDAELANWKTKILAALGENGQVLVDVIPELEQVIGKQPIAPELSGSAAQTRFNRLFEQFIAVFTTPEHPLTIFVDDLQWADSASLNLLKVLMEDKGRGYLLLLGAYRDNEVFPAHPLMLCLRELAKQNTKISTITLASLSVGHIQQLVAETLHCQLEVGRSLADLVYQKTQGNPFFTVQFLKGLYADKLVAFNRNLGYWECDLGKIRDAALTDDVVQFMMGRLHNLPEATQQVMKLAACIGNQFDLETLTLIGQTPIEEAAADLWNALQEGLILPQSEAYKFFQSGAEKTEKAIGMTVGYRFLHDRVQQAAYALIPADRKPSIHYRIGRLLLAGIAPEVRSDRLFEIVGHLNKGIPLMTEQKERDELARLNLSVGRKARAGTAYQAARNHAEIGLDLLGGESWQRAYDLTLKLHELAAEMAAIAGDSEAMDRWIEIAIAKSRTFLDRLDSYLIKMQFLTGRNQFVDAIECGRSMLKQLSVTFPDPVTPVELQREIDEIQTLIDQLASNNTVEDILDLPVMKDPEKLAILKIAARMIPACYFANSPLFPLLGSLQTKLSLQYGNGPTSSTGYADYGVFLLHFKKDLAASNQFGQLAYRLAARAKDKNIPAVTFVPVGLFLYHHQYHLREALPIFQAGYQAALDVGKIEYVGIHAQGLCVSSFWCGLPLQELAVQTRAYLDGAIKFNLSVPRKYCSIIWETVLFLLDNPDRIPLEIEERGERSERISALLESGDATGIFYFYLHRGIVRFLMGQIELARADAIAAKTWIGGGMGMVCEVGFYFYDSLIALADLQESSPDREATLKRVAENQDNLHLRSQFAPMNYLHKWQLVEAEKYRVLGKKYEAADWYDRAISGAKANEYIQDAALANELAAKFYLAWDFNFPQSKGRQKAAAIYLQEAYYDYARWEAKAKVQDLERRYPHLLASILTQPKLNLTPNATIAHLLTSTSAKTTTSVGDRLDFASLMKASRTLTREIEPDRAITNLMQVIGENAGAETVALLLFRDGTLMLEAKIVHGKREGETGVPVDCCEDIPTQIINRVKRLHKTLVLADACNDSEGAGDICIQTRQLRSILCLPLHDRGRAVGILYLENNQAIGAFTPDRIEILELLCAQATITLENARLYQQARQTLELERKLHDLQRSQLQSIQSEKMFGLGQLVAGIAHEINNPINFIHGNITHADYYAQNFLHLIELYQHHYPQTHPEISREIETMDLEFCKEDFQKIIQSMRAGSQRIQNLIASLRNFSRLDESAFKAVNLHEGIDSTLILLQTRLQAQEGRKAIQVTKDYDNLPQVECYAGQLNQVVLNILNNAIDALEASPAIADCSSQYSPQIRICTRIEGERVAIAISDNGPGIRADTRDRIFDPFFTTKAVGKGTGLGLSIAYQIVTEQHQGTISCQSRPGETTFLIKIPTQDPSLQGNGRKNKP